jgi:glycosyltransferase involved in cell wall biosynthesis
MNGGTELDICIVTSAHFPPEEGIGNYIKGLSEELISHGCNVTVLTRSEKLNWHHSKYGDINLVKAPFIPLYPLYMELHGRAVQRYFNKNEKEFDVINIHSPLSPSIVSKKPIIATFHTMMKSEKKYVEKNNIEGIARKGLTRMVSVPLERKLIKNSCRIVTVSNGVAQELLDYGTSENKISVVGNGVNCRKFHPGNHIREPFVLFVGRLDFRKGLFDLLESFKKISEIMPNLLLKIIGKGPLRKSLEHIVEKNNLEQRVLFLNHVSDEELVSNYQKARLVIIPSHYEGLPTVLLEAMACGTPVVATRINGNVDVIDDGVNGILVEPKKPSELTRAILSIIEDEEELKQIGHNGRMKIESYYSWKKIGERYLNIFQEMTKV